MVVKLIYRFILFHNIFIFIILKSSVLLAQDHFQVEIENTGLSQLFIFEESIIGLDIGDEIGIFDDCPGNLRFAIVDICRLTILVCICWYRDRLPFRPSQDCILGAGQGIYPVHLHSLFQI